MKSIWFLIQSLGLFQVYFPLVGWSNHAFAILILFVRHHSTNFPPYSVRSFSYSIKPHYPSSLSCSALPLESQIMIKEPWGLHWDFVNSITVKTDSVSSSLLVGVVA